MKIEPMRIDDFLLRLLEQKSFITLLKTHFKRSLKPICKKIQK